MINQSFSLSESDITQFKKNGFILLKDFLSKDLIQYLQSLAQQNIEKPNTNYGSEFNKLKYDLGNNDDEVLNLICDKILIRPCIN